MLTFEKILKVFQAYLDDDPLYEVVQTSHGYTLMAWEPHRNDWYSAEIQKTPEDLRNALLGTYANFLEEMFLSFYFLLFLLLLRLLQ